jgi:hypothetical protein
MGSLRANRFGVMHFGSALTSRRSALSFGTSESNDATEDANRASHNTISWLRSPTIPASWNLAGLLMAVPKASEACEKGDPCGGRRFSPRHHVCDPDERKESSIQSVERTSERR